VASVRVLRARRPAIAARWRVVNILCAMRLRNLARFRTRGVAKARDVRQCPFLGLDRGCRRLPAATSPATRPAPRSGVWWVKGRACLVASRSGCALDAMGASQPVNLWGRDRGCRLQDG
jgi:hypothetical protein